MRTTCHLVAAAATTWVLLVPWSTISRAAGASGAPPAVQLPGSPASTGNGVYSEPQAKRGEALYEQQCSVCHAADLRGLEAPPLVGEVFLSSWAGSRVGTLFERIRLTMPLQNPNGLSPQAYADVVAHIFQVNKFPAGTSELVPDLAVLQHITIGSDQQGK